MKLELIIFGITGLLILNTYYEGKYSKYFYQWKKYIQMGTILFIGLSLYLLFKKNPFLSDMMEKVEKNVKPGSSPMEAMSSMMQSGMLQELVQGMQTNINSGELNIQELMGTVQKLTGDLPAEQLQALQPMMGLAMQNMPQDSATDALLEDKNLRSTESAVTRGGKKKRKKKKKNKE